MTSHAEAKELFESLIPANEPELRVLSRLISWKETAYGDGMGDSNNMGAIVWLGKGPYYVHEDSTPTEGGPQYRQQKFQAYASREDGVRALASLLRGKYASAVAAVPDWPEVSAALYDAGYYEGVSPRREEAVAAHARWIATGWTEIAAATGEPLAPRFDAEEVPPPEDGTYAPVEERASGWWWLFAPAAGVLGVAAWMFKRSRKHATAGKRV